MAEMGRDVLKARDVTDLEDIRYIFYNTTITLIKCLFGWSRY